MVQVYASRYSPGLEPGDGEMVGFYLNEVVDVIDGKDKGREFMVLSDRMWHQDAPGTGYIREGYFLDNPLQTKWAKSETSLWFKSNWSDRH